MELRLQNIKNKYKSFFDEFGDHKSSLVQNGYTVFPLLNEEEIDHLRSDADQIIESSKHLLKGGEFLSAGRIEDPAIRELSTQSIKNHAFPKLGCTSSTKYL